MHKRGIIDVTIDTNALRAELKGKNISHALYAKFEVAVEALVEMRSLVMNDDDLYDGLSNLINVFDYTLKKRAHDEQKS